MAKDPAFLFYFRDFLVSTDLMSDGEVGCYIRILCHMADKGPLKEHQLKKIGDDINRTTDLIDKLKIDSEGRYYQERLVEESQKRKKFTKSRRDNLAGINPHMDAHMGNANEDVNLIEKQNTTKEERISFLEFVFMTQGQYDQLAKKLGKTVLDEYVERLNNYIGSKGKKYKSHYHTILSWTAKDRTEKATLKPPNPKCDICKGLGYLQAQFDGRKNPCKCVK